MRLDLTRLVPDQSSPTGQPTSQISMNQQPNNANPPAPRDAPGPNGVPNPNPIVAIFTGRRGDTFIIQQVTTWDPRWRQHRNGYLGCWMSPTGVMANNIEMALLTGSGASNWRLRFRAQTSARCRDAHVMLGRLGDNNPALVNAMQNYLDGLRRANDTADATHDIITHEINIPDDAEGPLTNPLNPLDEDPVYVNVVDPEPGETNPAMFAFTFFFGAREDTAVVRAVRNRQVPNLHQQEMQRIREEHQRQMQQQQDALQQQQDRHLQQMNELFNRLNVAAQSRSNLPRTPRQQPQQPQQQQPQPQPSMPSATTGLGPASAASAAAAAAAAAAATPDPVRSSNKKPSPPQKFYDTNGN